MRSKKPRTISEKLAMRDVYVYHKGTLKCKAKKTEIKRAGISVTRANGLAHVEWFETPFTESQAKRICSQSGYGLVFSRAR